MYNNDFWRRKRLNEMTHDEWEALCDGCGKCCLHKLEDVETGRIAKTNVSCSFLDIHTCSCTDYKNRQSNVSDCIRLTQNNLKKLNWLPETCAYRLLGNGHELPEWHHLVCNDAEGVHNAGQSVRGNAISETDVQDLELFVTDWLETDLS